MSANGISHLQYKADRQIAKLELAATKRAATGRRSILDTNTLPTVYATDDNDTSHVIKNSHPNGPVKGRPWAFSPVSTYLIEFRSYIPGTGPGNIITSCNEGDTIWFDAYGTNIPDDPNAYLQISGANITNDDAYAVWMPLLNLTDPVPFNYPGNTLPPPPTAGVPLLINSDNLTEGTETLTISWVINGQTVATASLPIGDTSTEPLPIINLDGSAPVGITANVNETGSDGTGFYLMVNGNYDPYWPIASATTSWTVTGGNLDHEPVLQVVTNMHGYGAKVIGVYVAVYPGSASVPYTFSPPSNVWTDSSTHQYDATLYGGATRSASFGGMIALNGTDGYITPPMNFVDWLHKDITITIWFRTTGTGIILGQTDSGTPLEGTGWVPAIYIGDDNKLYVTTFWHGVTTIAATPFTVNDGQWHMLTVTTLVTGMTHIWVDSGAIDAQVEFQPQQSYALNYYYYIGTGKISIGWPHPSVSPYMTIDIGSFKVWEFAMSNGRHVTEFNATKMRFVS